MIDPTEKDIGRFVVYSQPAFPQEAEAGRVVSFNPVCVFVSFPKRTFPDESAVQGCSRENLNWLGEVLIDALKWREGD